MTAIRRMHITDIVYGLWTPVGVDIARAGLMSEKRAGLTERWQETVGAGGACLHKTLDFGCQRVIIRGIKPREQRSHSKRRA